MSITLTPNACKRIIETELDNTDESFQPRIQLLSAKKLPNTGGPNTLDRHRMMISDGTYFTQAMLATQLNHIVESGLFTKNTVFTLTQYAVNVVQNKQIIIILGVDEHDVAQCDDRIGSPKSFADAAAEIGQSTEAPVVAPATVPKPQPPVAASSSRPTAGGGERPPPVYPIEGLSPYQNKWTIKARVTQKSDIKTWSNPRGEGKLFSLTLMDETGEIKATGFNAACDEHYDRIEEGKVYYISRARVNVAKKKFSNLANDYEITLEKTSEIRECTDTTDVPVIKYNFVELSQMENLQKDATCDVLAVLHEVGPLSEITTKATNKQLAKRELVLVDKSEFSIRMTLWGKQAEQFNHLNHPVIAFKGVKVGDFGGRTLSMFSGSTMAVDPDIPEAHTLRGWYDSRGANTSYHSQSSGGGGGASGSGTSSSFNPKESKPVQYITDKLQGMGDKPDYFATSITVLHVKPENLYYTACPGEGCSKKVTLVEDDVWRCEKCNRTYDHCEYRYLLSLSAADHTGQMWFQGFNDVAEVIIGAKAQELHALAVEDDDLFKARLGEAVGKKWNFSGRAKQETYNDVTRTRYAVVRAFAPDYNADSWALVDAIKAYN